MNPILDFKADGKEEEEKLKNAIKKKSVFMFLLVDLMYNFIDGVALGIAFAFSNYTLNHIF